MWISQNSKTSKKNFVRAFFSKSRTNYNSFFLKQALIGKIKSYKKIPVIKIKSIK